MKGDIKNIGIIGSGVAGLTAAYLLQKKHEITLLEKNDYIGGYTHHRDPGRSGCWDTG